MPSWLKSRLGTSIAIGTLAVGVVGGLAFAVAGPMMGSSVASSSPPASAAVQTAAAAKGACKTAGTSATSATSAASATTTAATSSGTTAKCARRGLLRRLLARTEHASLTVRGKGGTWVTVTVDRGTVQSVSATSITIVRPDGVSVTAPISSTTKFRRTTEAALVKGDHVVVVQVGGTARAVVLLKGPSPAGSGTGTSSGTSTKG